MLSYNMLRKIKTPWKVDIPFMMDSGAFAVIQKYGKYPFTPEEYASGIQKWHPDIAWTMDYPCEPFVQKRGDYNPRKSQEMTIDNQIRLLDLNTNTQMVVQGWTVQDYLENLDRIKEQGLLTEHLGIGSVCRRGQNREIARIVRAIHNNVPSWVKLHGFGIKVSVLKDTDARFYLHSVDSQSWGYEMRYGDWLRGQYNGKTWKDKAPNLKSYVSRIESMLNPLEPLYAEALK
jgi:queuine/archaeosine tRNA-ribosyltransferase